MWNDITHFWFILFPIHLSLNEFMWINVISKKLLIWLQYLPSHH